MDYYSDLYSQGGRKKYESNLSYANNKEKSYFDKREQMSDSYGSRDYDRAKREYERADSRNKEAAFSRRTVASMDSDRIIARRDLAKSRRPQEIVDQIIGHAYGEKGQRYHDTDEGRRQTIKHRNDRHKFRDEIEEFPDGKEVVLSYGTSRRLRAREPRKHRK